MLKQELIFDGNEKQIFATDDPAYVIVRFKDVTLAYGGIKRAVFRGKGALNNKISATLLGELRKAGLRTHFESLWSDREQLCRRADVIPIEFCVHNRMAGSLALKLGVPEGTKQPNVIYDLRYNNTGLGDPLINEHHAVALGLATYEELELMHSMAEKANSVLSALCHKAGIELVDMKMEFGRDATTGEITIADEISPDRCRLWDEATGERLDKDRFRLDLSDVVAGYRELCERLSEAAKED